MPFLRLFILFAFFAFSFAWAECDDEDDFEIFAETATEKKSLGCDEEVSTEGEIDIMYGDTLTLSVKPDTGTYIWTTSSGTIIKTGSSFSPKFLISTNPQEDMTETYKILKKGGLTKTIVVTISPRTTYTVYFDTDGADNVTSYELSQDVMKDSLATEPEEILTKEGYNFGGWNFDFKTPITKNIIIKAIWNIKAYSVSFDTDGGTPNIITQVVAENGLAIEPIETLTKEGYNFKGWNFDFKTPITKNIIIKAIWENSNLSVGDYSITFDSSGYEANTELSSKQRKYFVASPSRCEIKEKDSIYIHITVKEPNIALKINGDPKIPNIDIAGSHFKITFHFGTLGNLDSNTLVYEWVSIEGSRFDTILIQTPVPFKDPLIKKKWNNTIWFVNNNPKTNGLHDSIIKFKWFKYNNEVSMSQYYSATNDNPNEVPYNVVMQTSKGNSLSTMISTCKEEGEESEEDKENTNTEQTPKSTLTKQVLGIKEKSLNKGSKVYNLNGKLIKETPAGVYIVKEE